MADPALAEPTAEVAVVGGGVSGLTCALALQEAGFPTRLLVLRQAEDAVSGVAAAVWHPYRVGGERALAWAGRTLKTARALAADPASGVLRRPLLELHRGLRAPAPWHALAPGFRRATPAERGPFPDGFVYDGAVFDVPRYLPYLRTRYAAAGGRATPLQSPLASLKQVSGAVVVNAAGLGARGLTADGALYPVRGQVVRVTNPGLDRAVLDEDDPAALVYVIPRRDDCILGGTAEEGAWDLEPSEETTRTILKRARALVPELARARVLDVRVGLRPARPAIRLEAERVNGRLVVHNYGHGGAGYTCAWGCAEAVLDLVRQHAGA